MTFFGCNILNVNPLKCVSMNNLACKIRPQVVNVNSNNLFPHPYSIEVNKCSGSCNNINDPYTKLCIPNVAKNINVKVFNLVSRNNETRHIKWHEICICKCRLDASVCNNKQGWNEDKCRCKCKKLINKGRCEKVFIWNPSSCECECDQTWDVGGFLDYENCKCRKNYLIS